MAVAWGKWIGVGATASAFLVAIGACDSPPRSVPPRSVRPRSVPPLPSVPISSAPARTTPTVEASPLVSAAPATRAPTFAEMTSNETPQPPWPSGPGIHCGDRTCRQGAEFCCQAYGDEPSICRPIRELDACTRGVGMPAGIAMACDEPSDCGAGSTCCHAMRDPEQKTICVPASQCPNPICARGGSCRKGEACVDTSAPSGGECHLSKSNVQCGSAGLCEGDRPWCMWHAPTETGECIPRGPWGRRRIFECDHPDDCRKGTACCVTPGLGSHCGTLCLADLNHWPACDGPDYCATWFLSDGSKYVVWECKLEEDPPLPGMRRCVPQFVLK